ncbi:MAG: SUMF1/EgtB/PvdO family nonheme iron enzyme [Xanthomonadales bacterium]|nr:SUMF1/EgtB/PvdO family nonheme iron enzyme [Xanthomonadales bacterium]
MSREYFIQDARGRHKSTELELPIRVGGKKHAGVFIPGVAAEKLLAIIALDAGHAYIQPADTDSNIFHNDERLLDSAWLKSGDRVQIANSMLSWEVQGDRVLINVQPHKLDISKPRPPKQARQATAPVDNLPVSVKTPPTAVNKGVKGSLIAFVLLLVLLAGYLLTATSVIVKVEPTSAAVDFKGFPPAISFGGARLMFPGNYDLSIETEGYAALNTSLEVKFGAPLNVNYELSELPGLVRLNPDPVVEYQLFAGEQELSMNATGQYELSRGSQNLAVKSDRYLPQQLAIEVAGFGAEQSFDFTLEPAWAIVSFSSVPADAEVLVGGVVIGITPLQAAVLQGQHEFVVQKPGFKKITQFHTIEAGVDISLAEIQLEPADGTLVLSSKPAGASILIGDKFFGKTPQTLMISAETEHRLSLSKAGYHSVEKVIKLAADEQLSLELNLGVEYATVFISIQPPGSSLSINGKAAEKTSGRIRLQTRKNTLKVSKLGYISKTISVTPRAGVSQNIEIRLVSKKQQQAQKKEAATPASKTTAAGQKMLLISPSSNMKMGASRRDAGRRANESQRLVKLQRPFYMGQYEVTNSDLRKFIPAHNSGSAESAILSGDKQPVVNISWDDAARYCNWLSKKDALPMAYQEVDGKIQAVSPMTTGYRLPTEAEWAWVARREGQASEQRYPWQGVYPPTTKSGNYADARIADTLADIVPGYDDGFRGSAPVGSFPPWPAGASNGFYDMGGNVAEWMHDYYAVYPGEAARLVVDPMGPAKGKHHVVRGSSWRHGSISELRMSYRDYNAASRPDLGFRIARYAE